MRGVYSFYFYFFFSVFLLYIRSAYTTCICACAYYTKWYTLHPPRRVVSPTVSRGPYFIVRKRLEKTIIASTSHGVAPTIVHVGIVHAHGFAATRFAAPDDVTIFRIAHSVREHCSFFSMDVNVQFINGPLQCKRTEFNISLLIQCYRRRKEIRVNTSF